MRLSGMRCAASAPSLDVAGRAGFRISHPLLAAVLSLAVFLEFGSPACLGSDCTKTSVGLVPLNDLGAGVYNGQQGGRYPGGSNTRPPIHDLDLDRVSRVMLLDAQGQPDALNGRIVLMSVGMSNTTQEFSTFKLKADADPQKNSRVVIVDAAEGGQDATIISDPAAIYWTHVEQKLANAGVTPAQVQAVWLKEARARPTEPFPQDANILRDELRSIVQIIKSRYPSTRSIYLSSRIYAGYATSNLNPEPFAYQSAFAVKWLIEEQLQGSPALNFDPDRGPVMAPWLSWGPYLWADGLTPRSDGLIWECADFQPTDGTHPAAPGREKVATLLLGFLKSDPTTTRWFVDCFPADPESFAAPPEARGLQVAGAGGGNVQLSWESLDPVVGPGAVYDVVWGIVSQLRADAGFARASCLVSELPDTPFTDTRPGPPVGQAIYYVIRGRNACGFGTYGDSGLTPDPRDVLDAGSPSCP